jgi:phosphoribosylaminoimidazole-succinocarboxamide synthase
MVPLECVIRNQAAGSLCRRLGVKKETTFDPPLYELFYKSDELNDPLVGEGTAIALGWSDKAQLAAMEVVTRRVNTAVSALLRKSGIRLVDFKIEFGVDPRGRLVVGDEFSPDSCRMWDEATGESLDKDLFRQGLGGFLEAYRAVVGRLAATAEAGEAGAGEAVATD